jgi:mannose-6-phosphate isomerase-like protein (cupin superfamily)
MRGPLGAHQRCQFMSKSLCVILLVLALVLSCRPGGAGSERRGPARGDYGRPTVLGRGEGDQRLMRGTRPLFIVADSATVGSRTLVAGYEDVPPGDSGRTHMHLREDEMIFVHRGQLEVTLADSTYRAAAGTSIFIPRGTWIGFRTAGGDTAGFWFVFNTPAFEKCLRALSARPGAAYVPPPAPVLEQVNRECDWRLKAQ